MLHSLYLARAIIVRDAIALVATFGFVAVSTLCFVIAADKGSRQ